MPTVTDWLEDMQRGPHVRTMSGRVSVIGMSDVAAAPRRHRIEVRVTPEQDALIRQAASLEDETVTAFVLGTVTARATTVIEQHRDIALAGEAFDRFMAVLDAPATPVPQLTALFRRYPKLPDA